MWLRRRLVVQSIIVFLACLTLVIFCNIYLLSMHTKSQEYHNKDDLKWRQPSRLDRDRLQQQQLVGHTIRASADASPAPLRSNQGAYVIDVLRTRLQKLQLPQFDGNGTWNSDDVKASFELIGRPQVASPGDQSSAQSWALAASWVRSRQVYPKVATGLHSILRAMSTEPIVRTGVGRRGTQLKIMLAFRGGQRALFKPMRYSRNAVFQDSPYAGADRHNGEIAAFHLSRLLDLRWSPLVSGRRVNLNTEIFRVAETSLRKTFLNKNNNTCFYGACYYCNPGDPVCATGEILEGAIILWLPSTFKLNTHRHPWARTYKRGVQATWEKNDAYCDRVQRVHPFNAGPRLLDLVDVAIFDFLIGNADRHRYETFEAFNDSAVFLLDNGKSFGNPYDDELSILAPLYQCCIIRSTTVDTLRSFPGHTLSLSLQTLLRKDPTFPVLTKEHLYALDRRRYKVLDVVDWCIAGHTHDGVLKTGM